MRTADESQLPDRSVTLGADDTVELVATSSGTCGHPAATTELDVTLHGPPEPLMASSPTRAPTDDCSEQGKW